LQDEHPDTDIFYKKSKHHPLNEDERTYNHGLSRFCVRVEHAIAKLKSFRILSERYRNQNQSTPPSLLSSLRRKSLGRFLILDLEEQPFAKSHAATFASGL
jgi:hypothetical protein